MMNSKFGILITTKNTYSMVEEWREMHDYSGIPILNIDLQSETDLKLKGQEICKKYKIEFLDCNSTAVQDNLDQAFKYFYEKQGIEWILYMHHDAFPMLDDTLKKLNDILLNSDKIKNTGVIGFNIYHDKFDLNKFNPGKQQLMTTARAPLELGNGYYNGRVESRVNYKKFEFRPFVVESVMWSTALINYHQFNKYINVDNNFNFFHSWDDIAFQFLSKNVYNIVIPYISFGHDQSLKTKHNLPASSPNSSISLVKKLYGRFDHLSVWKKKWNFEYSLAKCLLGGDSFVNKGGRVNKAIAIISKSTGCDFSSNLNTVARRSYLKQNKDNKNLLDDFYNHDPKSGPLKYFDI
jgi:hypothetical protein